MSWFEKVLRREGDSNPRNPFGVYTLSRRASSTTRASLLRGSTLVTRHNTPNDPQRYKKYLIYALYFAFFLLFFLDFYYFPIKSSFALAVVTSIICSVEHSYTCAKRSATYNIQRLSLRLPRYGTGAI